MRVWTGARTAARGAGTACGAAREEESPGVLIIVAKQRI